jgi:hypothetical protein
MGVPPLSSDAVSIPSAYETLKLIDRHIICSVSLHSGKGAKDGQTAPRTGVLCHMRVT